MNTKCKMFFFLMFAILFAGACGSSKTLNQKQSESSELNVIRGAKYALTHTKPNSNGDVELIMCPYHDIGQGQSQIGGDNACAYIFMVADEGVGAKISLAFLKKWAKYLSNKGNFANFPNDRRKRNWNILSKALIDLLHPSNNYRAEYPISVVVHELAWFLIDNGYNNFDYICAFPVLSDDAFPVLSDDSDDFTNCMTAQYIREYHAVEKTRKNW